MTLVDGRDDPILWPQARAIANFLRDTLCYEGLVVSDDLWMEAISTRWGTAEAARLMVEAGGDIALVSLPADKGMALVTEVTDHLLAEAERSPTFADKVRHAFARVANHKLDLAGQRPLESLLDLEVNGSGPCI